MFLGYYWFERFKVIDKKTSDKMVFPTDSQVDNIMNTVLSINDWSDEMKLFIQNKNQDELIQDPSKIYIMELETFEFDTIPKQTMSVLVRMSRNCNAN